MLTRDIRDRAVAALRQAHTDNIPLLVYYPYRLEDGIEKVCSCVIIAEALGYGRTELLKATDKWGYRRPDGLYGTLARVGFRVGEVVSQNDTTGSFSAVADLVATFDVVDEAEAICRDAVTVGV